MATHLNATPLIAIDGAVIDTETTGLDAAKARLLEIAVVLVSRGRLQEDTPFRSLVQPGEAVPTRATAIHGLDTAALAEARGFATVWPEFTSFVGSRVLIGHSLGFDLAILKHECERAGIGWTSPRTLDVRLLAEAIRPNLPGYSLEELAAWLEVPVEARHSARGDALTTARIFLAMVPHLREAGIRTLAEAEQACRGLTEVLAKQHRAGWLEPVAPTGGAREQWPPRLDSYPFRHRVTDLMHEPQFCTADATVGAAVRHMVRARISSLFVVFDAAEDAPPSRPEEIGIITERDVLRAIMEHGSAALFMPVGRVANSPLQTIPADAFIYRAMGRMRRLKVRHLGVTDDGGRVCGAVSARDLLRQRAEEAMWLGEEIDEAPDAAALARAWAKLPLIARSLIGEDVSTREVAAIISREIGALTRRATMLGEQCMQAGGRGEPPCTYAIAVLGSAGRDESLLALDQDNALVFADGAPGSEEDRWFEALGMHLADILHEVGVPYCKGGVMAKNPQWRGSRQIWQDRIASWIKRSNPGDLLSVDIFFDLRGVYGDTGLTTMLRQEAYDIAAGEVGFAKLLAEAAGALVEQGLGWFGRIKTSRGRIDLKKAGLFAIVTTARVLAIRHHITERSTPARLGALKKAGIGGEQDLDALAQAQDVFLELILRQQIDDITEGLPPSNAVAVSRLGPGDRNRLRAALEAVQHLDDLTRDLLFRG